jgi:hypothetical protein
MVYLKKFATEEEYNSFKRNPVKKYVSLISATGEVKYDESVPNGIYINHIDGGLHTYDEWSSGGFAADQANGVAVLAPECSFIISKQSLSKYNTWSADTSNIISGVFTAESSDAAKADYSGLANTAILAVAKGNSVANACAAYDCANYEFPNGVKGYLPSVGEWMTAIAHKDEIDAAMSLIGGEAFGTNYLWSSTQVNAANAWIVKWSGVLVSMPKGRGGQMIYTRAFAAL